MEVLEFVLFTGGLTKFITRSSDDIRSVRTSFLSSRFRCIPSLPCDAAEMEAAQLAHPYLYLGDARDALLLNLTLFNTSCQAFPFV